MMRHEISGRTKKYCHAVVVEETWNLIRNDAPHKIEKEKQRMAGLTFTVYWLYVTPFYALMKLILPNNWAPRRKMTWHGHSIQRYYMQNKVEGLDWAYHHTDWSSKLREAWHALSHLPSQNMRCNASSYSVNWWSPRRCFPTASVCVGSWSETWLISWTLGVRGKMLTVGWSMAIYLDSVIVQ